jgi:sulfate/thiosulfate transport system substrate-binding protein
MEAAMARAAQPSAPRGKPRFTVPWLNVVGIIAIVLAAVLVTVKHLHGDTSQNEILNVPYDPTRRLTTHHDVNRRILTRERLPSKAHDT